MLPTTRKPVILEEVSENSVLKQSVSSSFSETPLTNAEIKLFTTDLRKISNSKHTKNIVDNLEAERKRVKFMNRIELVLEKLDLVSLNEDKEKLHNMFRFVMQSANDLLGPIESEDTVKLCVLLLKRFLNNDDVLCNQIFQIVKPSIKKLTRYLRYKHTFLRQLTVFFSLMCRKAI